MENTKSESVWITHVVNPHQFYFKRTSHIVNSEFSKFDFEIQRYGNELYAQKNGTDDGYQPVENELVIFFNIIYNKWIRGRVVSLGREITFWCIDNGIWEKWAAPHILQLTERFQEDMKLVHLGGLSLLPTEKTLNVETVEIETHLSKQWDTESINMFKRIIDTSKTFTFTEQFRMDNHKFGSLKIGSNNATKEINKILLAMNKVAPSNQYGDDDLWDYVHVARLEAQLHQSIVNGPLVQTAKLNTNNNNTSMSTVSRSSIRSGSVMSSIESLTPNEDFDDCRQSSSDNSTVMESQTKSPRRPIVFNQNNRQQSDVVRCENANETKVSNSAAENVSLNGDGLDASTSLTDSSTDNRMASLTQGILKILNDEGCLRSCKANFTINVSRRPLESTVAWVDSMRKSNSSDQKSSVANCSISHKIMLKKLAKQEPGLESTKIVNSSGDIGGKRFGIPAGYAISDLNSFGGLNKS